jgi:hypothetical protein
MPYTLPMSPRNLDRHAILRQFIEKKIKRVRAATLLSLSERQVTRLKQAVQQDGAKALIHAQTGKPSHNRLPEKKRKKIEGILKKKYADFTPAFAAEKLVELHRIDHDPKTIKAIMIDAGLLKPGTKSKNEDHRAWRQRKDAFGEMEQFDGSYHNWFEGRGGINEACLLASIDDATGMVTKAAFMPHEGVFPVMEFWKGYVESHGKPRSIYLDRFSTYKMNRKTALENPDLKTQFARVMEELHVDMIFALSPQAKGRVERLFKTLQDRLVKEMRLHGMKTFEDANRFLAETFLPSFNRKFAVVPVSGTNLHLQDELVSTHRVPTHHRLQRRRHIC